MDDASQTALAAAGRSPALLDGPSSESAFDHLLDPSLDSSATIAPPTRMAVIDIGSNSMRLVVAELLPGGDFRILDEERESTRLAKSLSTTHRLSEGTMRDALAALRRFKKIAGGFRVDKLRAIATCAVREAENGRDFVRLAKRELDLDIEVITSEQEAQLAFLSVQRSFDILDKNVVVADIGGGSTELVFASAGHIEEIFATPLGAVRLTEMFGSTPRLFGDEYERMADEIARTLKRVVRKPPFAPHLLIGTGGTFTNLAAMLIAVKGQTGQLEWGYRVTRADLRHLLDRLRKMTVKQRRNMPGLNSDRADIIIAGLAVIDGLMRHLKLNLLQVHNRGVRDGLLMTMIDELRPDARAGGLENREESLLRFAQSCGVDMPHARHVARLATQIFDALAEPLALSPADRPLLEAAALLQDVGYVINYEQHHKHSYHLIINSRLSNFQPRELELIANVARYHRGAKPKRKHENFSQLSDDDQRRVRQMAAILRLAGGLDRSHNQHVKQVAATVEEGAVRFRIHASDDPEVDLWSARRRGGLFEKVFERKVEVASGE